MRAPRLAKYLFFGSALSATLLVAGMILAQEVPVVDRTEQYSLSEYQSAANLQQGSSANLEAENFDVATVAPANTSKTSEANFLLTKINELQQEVQKLRGQLEVQAHDLRLLSQQQKAFYGDVDQRIAGLNGNGQKPAITEKPSPQPKAKADEPVVVNSAASTPAASGKNLEQEQAQYTAAYQEITQKNFPKAIQLMSQFLTDNPTSQYASNAHYWLGELFFASKDFNSAIKEFNTVLQKHPDSSKVAATLLKLGFSYQEIGDVAKARIELEKLQQQYPNTSSAHLASARLRYLADTSGS